MTSTLYLRCHPLFYMTRHLGGQQESRPVNNSPKLEMAVTPPTVYKSNS